MFGLNEIMIVAYPGIDFIATHINFLFTVRKSPIEKTIQQLGKNNFDSKTPMAA